LRLGSARIGIDIEYKEVENRPCGHTVTGTSSRGGLRGPGPLRKINGPELAPLILIFKYYRGFIIHINIPYGHMGHCKLH
jgi:hypothetical protein